MTWPDGSSGTKTVHLCSECNRLEGEQPQAGCCPGCGIHSEPIAVAVLPASLCEELAEALEYYAKPGAARANHALARYREAVAEGGGGE